MAAEVLPARARDRRHARDAAEELRRAVEAARLAADRGREAAARIAPDLVLLQDPAYLAVRHDGARRRALGAAAREPLARGSDADVSALEVLVQDHPFGGRSRLGADRRALAERSGRSEEDVAREWFARYCEVMVVSLLRLYLELGLSIGADQQNTLLELDGGWPVRCVLRDSQGYLHREAAHDDIAAVVPGIGEGSESIFPEALADERLVYYPFLNNALGVVNALGVAGAVDESVLLGDLRALLERERERGGRYPATLLDRLLDDADVAVQGQHAHAAAQRRRPLHADPQPAARRGALTSSGRRGRSLAAMPELPEVEITARRLDAALRGAQIESVTAPGINALKTFDPPLSALEGRAIAAVGRRGKHRSSRRGRPRAARAPDERRAPAALRQARGHARPHVTPTRRIRSRAAGAAPARVRHEAGGVGEAPAC